MNPIDQKNMKRSFILPVLLLALAAAWNGCKPEIEGELGDPIDKRAGFLGTWELSSFTQQDLNNPVQETRDLSHLYIQEGAAPLRMDFNNDDSYTIQQEIGRNYFGTGGEWAFDDPSFPTFLILRDQTDTLQYNLGATVRPYDNQMAIEYRRACGEGGARVETVIYTFTFNRIPQ